MSDRIVGKCRPAGFLARTKTIVPRIEEVLLRGNRALHNKVVRDSRYDDTPLPRGMTNLNAPC